MISRTVARRLSTSIAEEATLWSDLDLPSTKSSEEKQEAVPGESYITDIIPGEKLVKDASSL